MSTTKRTRSTKSAGSSTARPGARSGKPTPRTGRAPSQADDDDDDDDGEPDEGEVVARDEVPTHGRGPKPTTAIAVTSAAAGKKPAKAGSKGDEVQAQLPLVAVTAAAAAGTASPAAEAAVAAKPRRRGKAEAAAIAPGPAPRAGAAYSLDRPPAPGSEHYPAPLGALLSVGQEVLGIKSYRLGQAEALEQILADKDVLAVMPTGSGKSMLYQLPSLISAGVTVVVSPLIALIKDQIDKMVAKGVAAVRIDSTLTVKQRREVDAMVTSPGGKLLLTTPERMADPEFRVFLRAAAGNIGVTRFVVDEAHCVSQWGHDFRPAYLSLRKALEDVGHPPVLATTATAPPHVRADILHQLGIEDASIITTTFDRANLHYEVIVFRDEDEKMKTLVTLLRKLPRPGIVYAATVKKVEELHEALSRWSIPVAKYHGRMNKNERDSEQQRFMESKDIVMVATNAFGLGVDKPDIRNVLHYHVPGSLEAYAQEAGRGGRDGKPARCVLLFSPDDVAIQEYFLSGTYPTRRQVKAVYETLEAFGNRGEGDSLPTMGNIAVSSGVGQQRTRTVLNLLKDERFVLEKEGGIFEISDPPPEPQLLNDRARQYEGRRIADRRRLDSLLAYVKAPGCRNQVILDYLGEADAPPCGRCDNCLRSRDAAIAASSEAARLGASVTRLLDDESGEVVKPKRDIKARVVRIDQPATPPAPAAPPAPTVLRRTPGGGGAVTGGNQGGQQVQARPSGPSVMVRSASGPGAGKPGSSLYANPPQARPLVARDGGPPATTPSLPSPLQAPKAASAPPPAAVAAPGATGAVPPSTAEAIEDEELDDDDLEDDDDLVEGEEGEEGDDDEDDDDLDDDEDDEDDGEEGDEDDEDLEDDEDDDLDDDEDDDDDDDDDDEDDDDYEIIDKTAAELAEEGIEGPGEITILARKRVPKQPKVRTTGATEDSKSEAAAEARRRRRRRRRKRRAMLPPKSAFTTPVLSTPAPTHSPGRGRGGGGPVVEYVRGPMRIAMAPVASANPNDAGTDRRRTKRRGGGGSGPGPGWVRSERSDRGDRGERRSMGPPRGPGEQRPMSPGGVNGPGSNGPGGGFGPGAGGPAAAGGDGDGLRRKRRRRRRRPGVGGQTLGPGADAGLSVFQPSNGPPPPALLELSPDGEPRRRRRRRRRGRRKRPDGWQGAPPQGGGGPAPTGGGGNGGGDGGAGGNGSGE
jgi:ATP-dependent DNA helicase RecQ